MSFKKYHQSKEEIKFFLDSQMPKDIEEQLTQQMTFSKLTHTLQSDKTILKQIKELVEMHNLTPNGAILFRSKHSQELLVRVLYRNKGKAEIEEAIIQAFALIAGPYTGDFMTTKILVLGKYYKLFIKEIPNYRDKPLILHYILIILLGMTVVDVEKMLDLIVKPIFFECYFPYFTITSTAEFISDLCKLFYTILKYGSDKQCECLTMMVHNHYEGFELLLSLLEDLNIDKVKESESENKHSEHSQHSVHSEFSDDFEDSFECSSSSSSSGKTNTNENANINTNTISDKDKDEKINNDNYNVNEEEINELHMQLVSVLCGMGARCPLICERFKPIGMKNKIYNYIYKYIECKDIQFFFPT